MQQKAWTVGMAVVAAMVLAGCSTGAAGNGAAGAENGGERGAPVPVIALGDSITAGFAACGDSRPCSEASWATGSKPEVDSIARRLATSHRTDAVPADNLARPGARVADLASQAERVPEGSEALITVLAGANDICSPEGGEMTATADFRTAVDKVLQTIATRAPDSVVLLTSVPDLAGIQASLRNDERARDAWRTQRPCKILLAGDDAAEVVSQRVDEYDRELEAACTASANCVFDGGAVHRWRPSAADLSAVDMFHPSLSGQAGLAEQVWTAASANDRTRTLLGI